MRVGETATIEVSIVDLSTNSSDYGSFSAAMAAGVFNYNSGGNPGSLSWDGSTLTFTSDGTGAMAPLTFAFAATDDSLAEGPESFQWLLSDPGSSTGQDVTISGAPAVTTVITDTQGPGGAADSVTWTITGDVSGLEGGTASYTIDLLGQLQAGEVASVKITLSDISTNSADYENFSTAVANAVSLYNGSGQPGSFSLAGDQLIFTSDGDEVEALVIELPLVNDTLHEPAEQLSLTLADAASSTGAAVAVSSTDTVVTTIDMDLDDAPVVAVADLSMGESAGAYLTFNVTLSQSSFEDIDLTLALTAGTATGDGVDFGDAGPADIEVFDGFSWIAVNAATMAAGETTLLARTALIGDALIEADETLTLSANVASGVTFNSTASGTATIVDDDTATVSITATDAAAGEPGDNGQFTVSLSGVSDTNTVVSYTIGGTAASGDDFAPLTGTVTIAAGSTSAEIDVSVVDDAILESSETITVTLDSITSGDPDITVDTVNDAATVTITDDDTATVSITATDATAAELGDNGQFTVTLSNASDTDTVVTYTIDGTATSGDDFTPLTGTVTIAAGPNVGCNRRQRRGRRDFRIVRNGHRHARLDHLG